MPKKQIYFKTNAAEVAADFRRAAALTGPAFRKLVQEQTDELLFLVKLGATGWRGGPHVITSRYRDSIRKEITAHSDYETVGTVGTDEPYGDLLETGGYVTSANGEVHNIAPHPHFSNAIDYLTPDFLREVDQTINRLFGGKK